MDGIVRRRVFGNYYKGHMDKTMEEGGSRGGGGVFGWAGVDGWVENADNCS